MLDHFVTRPKPQHDLGQYRGVILTVVGTEAHSWSESIQSPRGPFKGEAFGSLDVHFDEILRVERQPLYSVIDRDRLDLHLPAGRYLTHAGIIRSLKLKSQLS